MGSVCEKQHNGGGQGGHEQANLQRVVALPTVCLIHGYTLVPSHAHLLSLAFEALRWCPQPTLPIDGERSRKIWRVLGTGDVHLTGQRCWMLSPQPPVPKVCLPKSPTIQQVPAHTQFYQTPPLTFTLTWDPRPLILNTFCSKPFILFLNYISFLDYKSDTLERTQPLRGSCRNGHGH